jgi:peptide/nickel transport system permease protein
MPGKLGQFMRNPVGVSSAAFILFLTLVGAFGPSLYRVSPFELSMETSTPPGDKAPLGTDDLGRDGLAGLMEGVKVSLFVGMAAAIAATVLGVVIGALAGYLHGWFDIAVMRIAEFFQVMPTFILSVLIVSLLGPGLVRIVIVIALLSWPQTARVARGEVLRVSQLEFVDSARCLGISPWRILFGEVIPNAVAPALALSTLIMAHAILLEASLSFLGLSTPDIVSWGRMLSIGQHFLFTAWWLSVFPGLAIFLTVLSFNLLGDALGEVLNPRRAR